MIVAMKKATVIARREDTQDALRQLRKLGVLHISSVPAQVLSAQEWREKKIAHRKGPSRDHYRFGLPGGNLSGLRPGTATRPEERMETVLATARSILDKHEAIRVLNEVSENLKKETLRLQDWEGVSASDLRCHPGWRLRDQVL